MCFRGIWWNFRSIIQSSHCEEDTQEMWFLCFDIAKQHHEAICFQSRWVSLNEKTVSKWKFTLQSSRMSHTIFILNLFTKILSRSEWVHLVFCNKGGEFFAKEHIQYCKTPSSMQHRSMKYFKIASLLIMIHNALLSSKITLRNSWFLHSTLAKINLHREGLVENDEKFVHWLFFKSCWWYDQFSWNCDVEKWTIHFSTNGLM